MANNNHSFIIPHFVFTIKVDFMQKKKTHITNILRINRRINSRTKLFALQLLAFIASAVSSLSQVASPSNWLYPDGNIEATRLNRFPSKPQSLDSFRVKWAISEISGDVRPLIGNIVNNEKINQSFRYAPNEIAAVVSGRIAIVDATGNLHKLNDYIPYIKDITVLLDTTERDPFKFNPAGSNAHHVMGIETIEMKSPDGMSHAFIAGFDKDADTAKLLRRLTLDLRDYAPNSYANIKPVIGRLSINSGLDYSVFSVVNCASPTNKDVNNELPYFRGITEFVTRSSSPSYPMPDIKDVKNNRFHLPGDVGFATPSIAGVNGRSMIALPYYAFHDDFGESITIKNPNNSTVLNGNTPYLAIFDVSTNSTLPVFPPRDLSSLVNGTKPQIRPYFVNTRDRNTIYNNFILIAEEYLGRDGSFGTPRLHLLNMNGDTLTFINKEENSPPFTSKKKNHQWSIAIGNVDGSHTNTWDDYFPNNPGNEIIVTETTRDFAVPQSRLYVMRYYSGESQVKPYPPDEKLFPFDTICTQRINGWVAAVNDIDGDPSGKDEVILVDGSSLYVLQMNDYMSYKFRSSIPFDTIYTATFKNQIISNVSVADLEGDGLNDIIVTTQDSTYLIGIDIHNVIKVTSPKDSTLTEMISYCVGDTISIVWQNVVKTNNHIDILFQATEGTTKVGDPIIIEQNFLNTADTTIYNYCISSKMKGLTGYFIVQQSNDPENIFDYTSIVKIDNPTAEITIDNEDELFVGKDMMLSGKLQCISTLELQYSSDMGDTWLTIDTVTASENGDFSVIFPIPCFDYLSCDNSDRDKAMLIRGVLSKFDFIDTTLVYYAKIKPMPLPINLEACPSACPMRTLAWNYEQLNTTDSTLNISISIDGGLTFAQLAILPLKNNEYKWNMPSNLPEEYTLRFCTQDGCIRTDTTLIRGNKEILNSVSPNPFNPILSQLEIVYKIAYDAQVTIKVLDAANNLVATPIFDQRRVANNTYCDFWNGLREDGSYCDNGIYYLIIELSNGERQVYPLFIKK